MSQIDSPPSVSRAAFACPHCGALTTQYWYKVFADEIYRDRKTPSIIDQEFVDGIDTHDEIDEEQKEKYKKHFARLATGKLHISPRDNESGDCRVENLHVAKCFHCADVSVWVYEKMIYPNVVPGIHPNSDSPENVRQLFEEARGILNSSPKGAAALLRLCVQHLCIFLGKPGKNINDDIASLVSDGLNPTIQQALDVVRVVGNEAVHPGTINLDDNREIALQLFELVNIVTNQMITHPKQISELYNSLPESKRDQIEVRDSNN